MSLTAQNYTDAIVDNARCAVNAINQLSHRLGCSHRNSEIDYAIFRVIRGETKRYMKGLTDTELATMYKVCMQAIEEVGQK